jgi:hypothetical protein
MKNHGFKTMVFHRHIFPMKNHGFGEIPGPSNWLKLKPVKRASKGLLKIFERPFKGGQKDF